MPAPTACRHCGDELPSRTAVSGRPPDYCGTACRQAAYRRRRRSEAGPYHAPALADAAVRELANDVLEEARHLVRLLSGPDAPLLDPVEQAVNLSRTVEALTAGLVGRARQRRVPWAGLGRALSMQPDTARRTYRAETVARRVQNAERGRPAGGPPEPPVAGHPEASAGGLPEPPAGPEAAPAGRPRSHLAPVLARLHRASGLSLRDMAVRLGISPSQASRILSGQRFPGWQLTERLAHVCGADPLVLRKVWEGEKLREERPPNPPEAASGDPAERLHTALQTLHMRAGCPGAKVLAEATRTTCGPEEITAVLGGDTPRWALLADLVQTLDGDLGYFQPLWEAASTGRRVADVHLLPAAPVPAGPPSAVRPRPSDERVVHLIEAFAPVLSATPGWP